MQMIASSNDTAAQTSGEDRSLEGWLTGSDRMAPGHEMPFEGTKDARARADLLAFLKEAKKPGRRSRPRSSDGWHGRTMGGMMGDAGEVSKLKNLRRICR
jgi:cytochrome c